MILELSSLFSIEQLFFKFSILVLRGMNIGNYLLKLLQTNNCDFISNLTPLCKNYSSRNRPYKNPKKSGHESRSPVVTEKSSLKSVCLIYLNNSWKKLMPHSRSFRKNISWKWINIQCVPWCFISCYAFLNKSS